MTGRLVLLFVLILALGTSIQGRIVKRYKYSLQTRFDYVPKTQLNITADVFYSPSSIRLSNVVSYPHVDLEQLRRSIERIFRETSNRVDDSPILNFLSSFTRTTCEVRRDPIDQQIESSVCRSVTAALMTIERKLIFHEEIEEISNNDEVVRERKTKADFLRLLNEICHDYQWIFFEQLIDLINDDLSDDELNEILLSNTTNYSECQRSMINQSIVQSHRSIVTEFLLRNFHQNSSIIEQHLNHLNDQNKTILEKYLEKTSPSITLRLLLLLQQDQRTINFGLNSSNPLEYRLIALRSLKNSKEFEKELRRLFDDENEPIEIRLISLQTLLSFLNQSDLDEILDRTRSHQIRFFLKSLSKQSSIWLGQSGSYAFPFGTINAIFSDHSSTFLPSVIQWEWRKSTLDFYSIPKSKNSDETEILLVFNRRSFVRLSTWKDLFNDQLWSIPTLDGFNLKIHFEPRCFKDSIRSLAEIRLKIEHGLGQMTTGFVFHWKIESNLNIDRKHNGDSTSYLWQTKEKEIRLFHMEHKLQPLWIDSEKRRSPSTKDLCYLIPHVESKLCLSWTFEHLWSSSVAIRLISDDPSLIYNLTVSKDSIEFHLQQIQQRFKSYRLLKRISSETSLPSYLEFSSPTFNYTGHLSWRDSNSIFCQFSSHHRSIANASGSYRFDRSKGFTIDFHEISPSYFGQIEISYNGNLTIDAREYFGGHWFIRLNRLSDWKNIQLELQLSQRFFFLMENYSLYFHSNLDQSSFNFTLIRNNVSRSQMLLVYDQSHFHHLVLLNSSLIEFHYETEIHYGHPSKLGFQTSSVMNGWFFWNASLMITEFRRFHIQLNSFVYHFHVDPRAMEFILSYSKMKWIRSNLQLNSSKDIVIFMQNPISTYQTHGKLSANYTDFSLDFPILDHHQRKSHCQLNFSSIDQTVQFHLIANLREKYFFNIQQNLTFLRQSLSNYHSELFVSTNDSSLISWNSSAHFNDFLRSFVTRIQLSSLLVSQPLIFNYTYPTRWFLQLFHWANVSRTSTITKLTTKWGFQCSLTNDVFTRLSLRLEEKFLGEHFVVLFQIDRQWLVSLLVNDEIRYELVQIPAESLILLKRIHLPTNQTRQLLINYSTDNETFFRLEIFFSKYFSMLINDFRLEMSLKNSTMRFVCHIPMFRREFFSLTWRRFSQRDFFHFHGTIQMFLLRRRRLLDFDYNYNFASIHLWTLKSRLIFLSFDPMEWNLNVTNDYFSSAKSSIDFHCFLLPNRELIRYHQEYFYHRLYSEILFHFIVINRNYRLHWNYSHVNQAIEGQWTRNEDHHRFVGLWNSTENLLRIETNSMKIITRLTSSMIKTIIHRDDQHHKSALLIERTTNRFTNDTEILECNPYVIIQTSPQVLIVYYYTLNDGLTTMMYEWSKWNFLSWNYTGHGRTLFPLRKFQIDLRQKFLLRLDTTTFEHLLFYQPVKHQLIARREPLALHATDRYRLKSRFYPNRTFLIHLQVIENHYEIIGEPMDEFSWRLDGYFRHDRFNGSLRISSSDWWITSSLIWNSSFYFSTGSNVQLLNHSDPQLAVEIRWKDQFHFAIQYASFDSLMAMKIFHPSSNVNFFVSSRNLNETFYQIDFHFNTMINQSWIAEIHRDRISLHDHNGEFLFQLTLKELFFRHRLDERQTLLIINENSIEFHLDQFGLIIGNRSSETSRSIEIYHRKMQRNLTISSYQSGRFAVEDGNIQTPIYDIEVIYFPKTDDPRRFVKLIFEFLPLQMSTFSFVRGRSFRFGYQTKEKQLILSGNLAFGLNDLDKIHLINMNERWKLLYGYEPNEKLFFKWNLNIDTQRKTLDGQMNIQDPSDQMLKKIQMDIQGRLIDLNFVTTLKTRYTTTDNDQRTIFVQLDLDRRVAQHQNLLVQLIHPISKTNFSFRLDRFPQRQFRIQLKPNDLSAVQTWIHLYLNTTPSELHIVAHLRPWINLNLTLPKSYAETGLLHSSLFLDDEEFYDVYLETSIFKCRSKNYFLNISFNEIRLKKRVDRSLLTFFRTQWLQRQSSTALINFVTPNNFSRGKTENIDPSNSTWLSRFKEFLVDNSFLNSFIDDVKNFIDQWKQDFIGEQGPFGEKFVDIFRLDEDLQLTIEQLNSTVQMLLEITFQLALDTENLVQEYMNNLTLFQHHQNVFHRNFTDVVTLSIDSLVDQLIHQVNRTSMIFNHFIHYPRSISAILSYFTHEIILPIYEDFSQFYLQSKRFLLEKVLHFTNQIDLLINFSPILFDSITLLSSQNIRTVIFFLNTRLRHFVTVWMNSPLESKVMKTVANLLIDAIDTIRLYLDDRLDFLLPRLQIFSPRTESNAMVNQTFLLSWSKDLNISNNSTN